MDLFCSYLIQFQGGEPGTQEPKSALELEQELLTSEDKTRLFILAAGTGFRLHYSCYSRYEDWNAAKQRQETARVVRVVVSACCVVIVLRGLDCLNPSLVYRIIYRPPTNSRYNPSPLLRCRKTRTSRLRW